MLEQILQFDESLFHIINSEWTHHYLDIILPFFRNKTNWIPLYIFLVGFIIYKFKIKKGILIIICSILTIGLADFTSSQVLKKSVERPRPCHEMNNDQRLLVPCGSGYSFTSSHATNHFSLAAFLGLILFPLGRWIPHLLLIWAGIIAYAQIYVGVHYPLDVTSGAFLGIGIGFLIHLIYKKVSLRLLTPIERNIV